MNDAASTILWIVEGWKSVLRSKPLWLDYELKVFKLRSVPLPDEALKVGLADAFFLNSIAVVNDDKA